MRLRYLVVCFGIAALTAVPRAQTPTPTFVEVHGHRVALYISGSGPTVVMEAGGGSWHRDWVDVAPRLARNARVVMYDRPGYGQSEACSDPRTADRVSRELHTALRQAKLDGPYVMVGWSLGGVFTRVFAGNFPEAVRGLVLVDPAVAEFYEQIAVEYPDEWSREVMSHFPVVFGDAARHAEQQELAAFESSVKQARLSDSRHRAPTVVLIAGRDDEVASDPISKIWVRELTRWAGSRPNTTPKVVARSGHHIPRQSPAAVIEAVEEVIARSRQAFTPQRVR